MTQKPAMPCDHSDEAEAQKSEAFDDHPPVADTSFADFLVQVGAGDDLDS